MLEVSPNWASPPGETILAVLHAKGMSVETFGHEVGLDAEQANKLLAGALPVTQGIAKELVKAVGSTVRFWLEREKQYHSMLEKLAQAEPELSEWGASFPIGKMVELGWLPRSAAKTDLAFELLDYFEVDNVEQWRQQYLTRLGLAKFRTSKAFQNDASTTLAWIRRGEVIAEDIKCKKWNRETFAASLEDLKPLSKIEDPKVFVPRLQEACAEHGVAVVVARSIYGCAASGATIMLDKTKALLLLSARFLSDDQFWFSFFHEAGHLILHGDEPHIEQSEVSKPQEEDEANKFAEETILFPVGIGAALESRVSPYSIARLARQCNVSPGLIVGQLQFKEKISPKVFNKFKTRYRAESFTL